MHNEFTAIIEQDEGLFVAYCPEISGANGQGKAKLEAIKSLSEAITAILDDRREDALRGLPARCRSGTCGRGMKREGASYSLGCNPSTGRIEAVPRHTEVASRLVRKNLQGTVCSGDWMRVQ